MELEVLVKGVFDRRRFLDLRQHFIAFEEDPDSGALPQTRRGLCFGCAPRVPNLAKR